MAYPKSRSANAELHTGMCEGSHNMPGKDWSVNRQDIALPERADEVDRDC